MGSSYDRFAATADAMFFASVDIQSQRAQMANYPLSKAAQYLQNNKTDEALVELKKALAFDPQNSTALTYTGKLYLAQGKNYEAIKAFKDLVRAEPNSVNALVNLGNAYVQDKQYTESEKAFKAAARLDPLNPLPAYTLGHQYMQTGRLKEAEAEFRKVEKISPRDGNVFYSLGTLYNKEEKFEDAVKNLKKALDLKKDIPAVHYELGIAYDRLGDKDKAVEQLKILKKTDTSLASDLEFTLTKPRLVSMDTSKSGGFVELMGGGTPLWALDLALKDPNTDKKVSIQFQFSNEMDLASVTNPSNWSISRANSTVAGYYNNTMPVTSREVSIPKTPLSVTYDPTNRTATISFRLSQNANGDATIDPMHLVFKFAGKDSAGRSMDETGNEIDGFALKPF